MSSTPAQLGESQRKLVDDVSALLHSDKPFEAAKLVRAWVTEVSGKEIKEPATKTQAYDLLNVLLHWCLNQGIPGLTAAAQMLWGPTLFDPRPESTQRVWKSFEEHNQVLLMGSGSVSKSFSMAVRLMLAWIQDPEYTTVKVLGPSEQHLEDNLFTHLVSMHRGSTIPLPGEIGKLFIGLDPRSRKGSISGVIIPLGRKAAGRLQGVKRIPRKKPHPVFGPMSRMYVFLDEVANLPAGIWKDIENVLSNTDGDGLKIFGAFNPVDQNDQAGKRCEPIFGWPAFDPDTHYEWTSTRGWRVLRLDAARCENVVQKRVIYPGLQTYEGFQAIIASSGGLDSPGYWTFCRGCFPPMGTVLSVIPPGMLASLKAEPVWYENPTACGGVDLALEGGDTAKFASGRFGLAVGIKFPPSLAHPNGNVVMFKSDKGRVLPRYLLLLDKIISMPKGDTVAMKSEVVRLCQALGIQPEWLAVDRTGNGQGVFDLLKYEWSAAVTGVNFSAGPTERRIMVEDSGTPKELYDRVNSELWFALRKWSEFGYFKILPSVDTSELFPQLSGRLYRGGKFARVEGKPDYRSRNAGKSPDDADAVCLLLHVVRIASGVLPGVAPGNTQAEDLSEDDDGWESGYVDATNRFSDLDT